MGYQSVVQTTRTTSTRAFHLGRACELGLLTITEVHKSIPRIDEVDTYLDQDTGELTTSLKVSLGTDVSEVLRQEVLRRIRRRGKLKDLPALAQLGRSMLPGAGLVDRLRNLGASFRLSVTSESDRPVQLLAGDLLVGGHADRVVAQDTVIPAHSLGTILEARCVEGGRNKGPDRELRDAGMMLPPTLRYTLLTSNQITLWVHMVEIMQASGMQTPAASYVSLPDSPVLSVHLGELASLLPPPQPPEAVGLALRLDGEVVCADLFDLTRGFARCADRLGHSYLLEAACRRLEGFQGPVAIEFLRDALPVRELRKFPAEHGGHAFYFREP